eukprot:TRINITY_DN57268_c0_g1_i1.p1 TRINITY_DN57268_c0_g1~~TRINITY_DN57268_c0_g1_i1.p1  ORF type:complete len:114 (-),score=22.85 TRINITY_DN57268_c0_g1_i1:32-340(-)
MLRSLVGSEMCIRDSAYTKAEKAHRECGISDLQSRKEEAQLKEEELKANVAAHRRRVDLIKRSGSETRARSQPVRSSRRDLLSADIIPCLLYTSDAADEEDS